MPKAEANNWSASHRQIVIFCEISSNNCFIIHLQSITLSFVKINELYTQTLFLKKLPDYIVFVDFPCLQILPKDTDSRFSSFFVLSEFFPVVNKTTRLLIVQENEPPLFTKSGGNAHAQTIICRWATFLTNAHTQTIICTQLFAGKLTNQNWEYYKVNNNRTYTVRAKNDRNVNSNFESCMSPRVHESTSPVLVLYYATIHMQDSKGNLHRECPCNAL